MAGLPGLALKGSGSKLKTPVLYSKLGKRIGFYLVIVCKTIHFPLHTDSVHLTILDFKQLDTINLKDFKAQTLSSLKKYNRVEEFVKKKGMFTSQLWQRNEKP